MDYNWLSLIPLLVVIPIVIWTKQVIPGLVLGLIVGSYLMEPSLLGGLEKSIFYISNNLAKENNILIVLFLYLFSGLIEIIKVAGGIKGFAEAVSEKIKNKKEAMILTWFSTIGTFTAPTFRVVTVTPIMKALLERLNMPARELAFMIETTSTPIIVIMPIATAFVGYMTSLIRIGLANNGIEQDAYLLFIKSIPYNFFAILMILLGIYLSFFHQQQKEALENNHKTKSGLQETREKDWHDCHPVVAKDLPAKPLNLLLPLFLLFGLTFFITWLNGYQKGRSILESFLKAEVLLAMVIAIMITIFLTIIFFLFQKISFQKITSHFIIGGNELMKVILLLTIVWALAAVTEDLGLSDFIMKIADWIPGLLITPGLFVIGALLSYLLGSSWGSWGILMPLGISLAYASQIELPLVIGAVFAGGTFGAFSSPISGTTILITKILELPTLEYARYKLKPALYAAVASAILYAILPLLF